VQLRLRFEPLQWTLPGSQPWLLDATLIARMKAASVADMAQLFGSAVGGAGGLPQIRGSPATGCVAGQAASPVLLAQNLPPGSARAQTRDLPRCQVAVQRNLEYFLPSPALRALPSP